MSALQGSQRPRPTTDNAPSIGLPRSLPAPQITTLPPFRFAVVDKYHSSTQTTSTPFEDITTPEQKPKPLVPKWSVEYNPELERVLGLHLAHVFTYDCPRCVGEVDVRQSFLATAGNDGHVTLWRYKPL